MGAVMPIQNSYSSLKTTVVKAEMAQNLQREIFEGKARRAEMKRALEAAPPLESVAAEKSGAAQRA